MTGYGYHNPPPGTVCVNMAAEPPPMPEQDLICVPVGSVPSQARYDPLSAAAYQDAERRRLAMEKLEQKLGRLERGLMTLDDPQAGYRLSRDDGSTAFRSRALEDAQNLLRKERDMANESSALPLDEGDSFSFPADRDFWVSLAEKIRTYPGASEPPHFDIGANHTSERLLVNQEFLRRFVAGWGQLNPHQVRTETRTSGLQTYNSDTFWEGYAASQTA